jgi:hypothetical protein
VSVAARPGTLPAVFMRGGASMALMLHRRDVPGDRAPWEPVFLSAMGSPDPFGRQLNGMCSGILTADASVVRDGGVWRAGRGAFFRTARPLMRGEVFHDAPAPVRP